MSFIELLFFGVLVYYLIYILLWMLLDCNVELWFRDRFFGTPISSMRGQIVWITGASSGIGKHLALQLSKQGVRLVISARREQLLEEVKKSCLEEAHGLLGEQDVLVLPMDMLQIENHETHLNTVLQHSGLRSVNDQVVASKAGLLHFKEPNTYWVDNYQRRYVPVRNDLIIGVITAKLGDYFRVDIGGQEAASLSYLAFEGATKKNRPDVSIGDLLYARLVVAARDLEPEIVCVNSMGKKGKLGLLADGFMFTCSLNLARQVLQENNPLLKALTREMPFEIAVGLNGRIWVRGKTTKETIAIGNAILASEHATPEEIKKICENIGNKLFM